MGKGQLGHHGTARLPYLTWVCLQDRRRGAESDPESSGGRLPAATARLCPHCFPGPPSGPH